MHVLLIVQIPFYWCIVLNCKGEAVTDAIGCDAGHYIPFR